MTEGLWDKIKHAVTGGSEHPAAPKKRKSFSFSAKRVGAGVPHKRLDKPTRPASAGKRLHMSEALVYFRSLVEKVGDYVTTADGIGGYVVSAKGGKLAVQVSNQPHDKARLVWVDRDQVTVNPGGAP